MSPGGERAVGGYARSARAFGQMVCVKGHPYECQDFQAGFLHFGKIVHDTHFSCRMAAVPRLIGLCIVIDISCVFYFWGFLN